VNWASSDRVWRDPIPDTHALHDDKVLDANIIKHTMASRTMLLEWVESGPDRHHLELYERKEREDP
jgi:hypothetical protein